MRMLTEPERRRRSQLYWRGIKESTVVAVVNWLGWMLLLVVLGMVLPAEYDWVVSGLFWLVSIGSIAIVLSAWWGRE